MRSGTGPGPGRRLGQVMDIAIAGGVKEGHRVAMYQLTIHAGPGVSSERSLGLGTFVFGRASTVDVVVDHPTVSQRHCQLTVELGKGIRLLDLGSANGTELNGRRVSTGFVAPGDVLKLGEAVVLVELALGQDGNPHSSSTTDPEATTLVRESFYPGCLRVFGFPFRSDTLAIMAAVGVLNGLSALLPSFFGMVGWLAGMAVGGWVFLSFRNILDGTARGLDAIPPSGRWSAGGLPELREQLLGCVLLVSLCLAPFPFLRQFESIPAWSAYAWLVLGWMYLPMAILMFVMTEELSFANPLNAALSISRVPLAYAWVLLLALPAPLSMLVSGDRWFPQRMPPWLMLFIRAGTGFAEVYFLFVLARALGWLYHTQQDRLGWYDERSE